MKALDSRMGMFRSEIETYKIIWLSAISAAWNEAHKNTEDGAEAFAWIRRVNDDFGGFDWVCGIFGWDSASIRKIMLSSKMPRKYAPPHGKYDYFKKIPIDRLSK